jgi:hypothetical protein
MKRPPVLALLAAVLLMPLGAQQIGVKKTGKPPLKKGDDDKTQMNNHDSPIVIGDGSLYIKFHDAVLNDASKMSLHRDGTPSCWNVLSAVWTPSSSIPAAFPDQTPAYRGTLCPGVTLTIPLSVRSRVSGKWSLWQEGLMLPTPVKEVTLTHNADNTFDIKGDLAVTTLNAAQDLYSYGTGQNTAIRIRSIYLGNPSAAAKMDSGLTGLVVCDPNTLTIQYQCPTKMTAVTFGWTTSVPSHELAK